MPEAPTLHGLMAAFESPEVLVAAVRRAREQGFRQMDAYTPYPVDGLSEALDLPANRLPLIVLLSGLAGGLIGYGMQVYAMAVHWPLDVGGRPLNSWPMFVPITFELTILFGAFGAVFGMLALNRLPQPYHPAFNAPCFDLASLDRFFLSIEASDPQFDPVQTRLFLESLGPTEVGDVEA